MSEAFEKIKELIHKLEPEEKQQLILRLRASVNLSGGISQPQIHDTATDFLTDAVRQVIIRKGWATASEAGALIRHHITSLVGYGERNELMRNWIEKHFQPQNEFERALAARRVILALLLYLRQHPKYQRTGVGTRDLLENILNIPAAVEVQFPGYAANGLLKLIVDHSGSSKRSRRGQLKNR